MSKNFIITSHTEGGPAFEKRALLHRLVQNLKLYFPDSLVVIASSSQVELETQKIADYVLVDGKNIDHPHGQGEIKSIQAAIQILKQFGADDFFKLCYDFIIDESNYNVFDQWLSYNKSFVSCYWRTSGIGIGTWAFYSSVDFINKIFDFEMLDTFLEWKVLDKINEKSLINDCFIYENPEDLFNGDWSKCDLINSGGYKLKYDYGKICAVVDIIDKNSNHSIFTIRSLLDQEKLPDHICLVDYRNDKTDLRIDPTYSDIFLRLDKKGITWNLMFYHSENNILNILRDLNHTWCFLVKNGEYLKSSCLKNLFRETMFIPNVGVIKEDNNILFRNNVIMENSNNSNLSNFIVDEIKKTKYTCLEL